MTETAVLWLLGLLVVFLAALVGIIYNNVIKNQDKADDRALSVNKEIWVEINKLKEWHHSMDSTHKTLCQKHEDEMTDLSEEITQLRSLQGEVAACRNSIRILTNEVNRLNESINP